MTGEMLVVVIVALLAVCGFALVAYLPTLTIRQREDPEQRAAKVAQSWPVTPAYRVTHEAQRVKARRTLRFAHRVFLAARKVQP